MSQYYAPTYGTALVLSEKEYFSFLKQYKKICKPIMDKEDENDLGLAIMEEDCSLEECFFAKSEVIKEKIKENLPFPKTELNSPNLLFFNIQHVSTDESDGMGLYPMKKYKKDDSKEFKNLRSEDCYAIWSDKSTSLNSVLNNQTYKSKDEIINEYKTKLQAYLPDDFDWEEHIGSFSFCTFA